MHKAFPLPVTEFPLPEELPTAREDSCHCQKKREGTAKKITLLSMSRRNFQLKVAVTLRESLSIHTTLSFHTHQEMDQQYPTVIKFGDSYEVPISTTHTTTTDTTSGETGTKSGRTVTLTAEDMQKKENDVKARTTLLLSLPDEHQLRFTKHSSRNEDGNSACIPTALTNAPTASASVATISQDTACAYIASQSSGSQIKFKDINQIDKDDIEEMDIKWNVALLSMRADKFWKRTGKKISIQGSDVAGFDKSKVECFNCHKMGHFARECRAPRSQDRGRGDNFRQGEDHALVADEEAPIEFALMANTCIECKDDIVTDYNRPEPTVKSSPYDDKKINPSVSETVASPIIPKPFVKFVKASDSKSKSKTDETETPKKSPVKYAEQYIKTNKKPNVRGN
uniref:Ribonuclease H-like domain-containing protein n=1 Tax=Tanacetum cinerariifolium TaxID=118510 RepID=A0A699JM40_TANCI|nr:ribonuclease H-like domain-containing protein [Tanacetum cinerariifolium]